MSATAVGLADRRAEGFYASTVGKKVVMAVSGAILFTFVIGHLVGNLQIYEGPEKLNHYAVFLRTLPALLWGARITLFVMVVLHVWSSVQLAARKWEARPIGYVKKKATQSSYASRTMYWSGPIILAFVIYHLLDLTWGKVNPNYHELSPYENVVASFSVPWVAVFYIVAMILLCMHLYHGIWSMFQTLGLHHPYYSRILKHAAAVAAILIGAGNISIPIAVLTGLVR